MVILSAARARHDTIPAAVQSRRRAIATAQSCHSAPSPPTPQDDEVAVNCGAGNGAGSAAGIDTTRVNHAPADGCGGGEGKALQQPMAPEREGRRHPAHRTHTRI